MSSVLSWSLITELQGFDLPITLKLALKYPQYKYISHYRGQVALPDAQQLALKVLILFLYILLN